MPLETQCGAKDESTYGTAVTVDRFFEYLSENIEADYKRVEYAGLRSGQRVQRSDRFVPYMAGARGPVKLNPLTKGFGFWLKHMLGTVGTSGPTDSAYTHTGSVGSLLGDYFTFQVNRHDATTATDRAFTWEGGKVSKWELANSVEGLLEATLEMDFEDEKTATALASASYSSAAELFSWVGGAVTFNSASYEVDNIRIACDNGLDVDRRKVRSSTLKKEPVEAKVRQITWEFDIEFTTLTLYNFFASTVASSTKAALTAAWTAPTLIGASTYPSLTATIPAARVDAVRPAVSGEGIIIAKVSGRGLYNGTDSPISLAYVSADTTP